MDNTTIIAMTSIITAGLTTGIGCIGPAIAEGRSVVAALGSLAQQPDAASTITRTLFVGVAMILFSAIQLIRESKLLITVILDDAERDPTSQ